MTDSDAATGELANRSNESCAVDRGEHEGISDRWARHVWSAGSYEEIAPNYLSMGAHLVERTGVSPGDRVLDVGCGTGTVAITAARRGAHVTGLDITPELLERARKNAEIAGVDRVSWREGSATGLPFAEGVLDITLSNLGHVYGDPPDAAADELLRVTRSGGRIGFTSWTPAGVYPSMAGAVVTVLSPEDLPDFSEPPFLWGDPETVRERLGTRVEDLEFETRMVRYPALSPAHFWHRTATRSGIFAEVLDAVDEDDLRELRERSIGAIEPHFDDGGNAVELEYLLTTATVAGSDR